MFIRSVELQDFRAFNAPTTIELAQGITCIAGLNGTGKSTVLAALGNCGELKLTDGRHLNGSRFRANYADIIRKDAGDTTGNKARIHFAPSDPTEEIPIDSLGFRATIQSEKDRFRLIPIKKEQGHERKLSWPTYYLGLSRLYPVGESDDARTSNVSFNDEEATQFVEDYKAILSTPDQVNPASLVQFPDAKKKIGAAVSTEQYGVMANSAGQDNLGQIILTAMSFARLKEELGSDYRGGLFLIDEIDATLHPAAQNKLYTYLVQKARILNLQIVFTTHSLSLLEHIHDTGGLHPNNSFARLLYFSRDRGRVEIDINPSMRAIKSRLRVSMAAIENKVEVPLLTEDSNAAEFVEWLVSQFYEGVNLRKSDAPMGFQQLAQLAKSFPDYFLDSLIIFDGDVKQPNNLNKVREIFRGTNFTHEPPPKLGQSGYCRYYFLPCEEPIETVMWDFMSSLGVNDEFYFDPELRTLNITKQTLLIETEQDFSHSNNKNAKALQLHKWWFEHPTVARIRPKIFKRWLQDNQKEISDWVNEIIAEYSKIGKRLDLRFELPQRIDK